LIRRGEAQHGGEALLDIRIRRRPAADADAHGGTALPNGRPAPAGPVALNRSDDAPGFFRLAERHQHLIQYHLVQDLEACLREAVRKAARLAAVALKELGKSRTAERTQRCPYFNPAGAPRQLRSEVRRVALRESVGR